MRLRRHINESEEFDLDNINSLIHKNCKQYLRLISGKTPLLRGMKSERLDDPFVGIKDVRKDRMPFGMSPTEANFLNDWLQKNGHARRDKSVICTSDKEHIEVFGDSYMIFPLDPIKKYTWLHSQDMNLDGDVGWEWSTLMSWMKNEKGEATDIQKNTLSRLKMPFSDFFTTNNEFKYAYDRGYEIWIDCDKYYYVGTKSKWNTSKQEVYT
jgi:hypothetical protein